MSEPQVAPYGGLLTKSLEDEKSRETKLKSQSFEIVYDGEVQVSRPEALLLGGVDSLSSEDIKAFVDYYLNYISHEKEYDDDGEVRTKVEYEALPLDEQTLFRIQWVHDSAVNLAFKTMEDAHRAYFTLVETEPQFLKEFQQLSDEDKAKELAKDRQTKSYNPTIEFRKQQNLSNRLGLPSENTDEPNGGVENNGMDEDESSVVLTLRQSFQSDRKLKNASAYSRYYLLHGEPERKPWKKRRGDRSYRARDEHKRDDSDDLFAHKLKKRAHKEEEEDLFADKLQNRGRASTDRTGERSRSRSPMRLDN